MEECKSFKRGAFNILDVKGGDVVQDITTDRTYLVCMASGVLRLHCLSDGNIYSSDSLFGGDEGDFKLVKATFKVEG